MTLVFLQALAKTTELCLSCCVHFLRSKKKQEGILIKLTSDSYSSNDFCVVVVDAGVCADFLRDLPNVAVALISTDVLLCPVPALKSLSRMNWQL